MIPVYGDADEIVALTGNEIPRNGRIVLLDPEGKVIWFHDRGFAPRFLSELAKKVSEKESGGGT